MRRRLPSFLCVAALLLAACGSDDDGGEGSAGTGGSAPDAMADTAPDTSVDAGMDAQDDALPDGTPDVAEDAATDAGNPDALVDVAIDVPIDVDFDVPFDVPFDIPMDVPLDVPMDVPFDVPMDVPLDIALDVPLDVPFDTSGRPPGQCKADGDCSGPMASCSMSAPGGICLGCGSATDCGNPLEFECTGAGSCRAFCEGDEDCPWGLRCGSNGACQLISCSSSCPTPYVCSGGLCRRPQCSSTPPACPTGMACGQESYCVEN